MAARRSLRRLAVAAIVVLAHLALFRILTPGAPAPRRISAEAPLEVMIFSPARLSRAPRHAPRLAHRARRSGLPHRPIAPSFPGPITLALPQRAPRVPIHWREQIRREVQARELRSGVPAPHPTFGFPAMAPRGTPSRRFGWDYAGTHRIEMLRGAGMLINISDRCSLLFAGVLIPFCRIGRIPANGNLFRHLQDATREKLGALP
jgi:hypothetical protein